MLAFLNQQQIIVTGVIIGGVVVAAVLTWAVSQYLRFGKKK